MGLPALSHLHDPHVSWEDISLDVAITLWSAYTQVPPVANQFGMVKLTVSKGSDKTSKATCRFLSLIKPFQDVSGGQRPKSLHAHSSRKDQGIIQTVIEPSLPHDGTSTSHGAHILPQGILTGVL